MQKMVSSWCLPNDNITFYNKAEALGLPAFQIRRLFETKTEFRNERPTSCAGASRPERMESEEPFHRLEGPRPHRKGHRGSQGRRPQIEGAGAIVRHRVHLSAAARPAHARSDAGRD